MRETTSPFVVFSGALHKKWKHEIIMTKDIKTDLSIANEEPPYWSTLLH